MSVDICNRDAVTEAPRHARQACAEGERRASAASAIWKRALRVRPAKSMPRSPFATACSSRKCRRELPAEAMRRKRDVDAYDAFCDHLLVLDRSIEGDSEDQIVGTYRLLRQDVAMANGGFYSASEFDDRRADCAPSG
jgi:hypothetical protein